MEHPDACPSPSAAPSLQTSSIGGWVGATGRGPYSAAKFSVEGFSELLAAEMALFGVRVTIVEPGGFRTDFAGTSTKITDDMPGRSKSISDGLRPGQHLSPMTANTASRREEQRPYRPAPVGPRKGGVLRASAITSLQEAGDVAAREFGGIDVLFANAGIQMSNPFSR